MLKAIKKRLKDQRGLTLIELLAVVVILGIIAAIAVPSIGNIIQNTRVDAVKAEAIRGIDAAKLFIASEGIPADNTITAAQLEPFIDDLDLTNVSVRVDPADDNELSITANGLAGTVAITFQDATLQNINAANNEQTTIGVTTD